MTDGPLTRGQPARTGATVVPQGGTALGEPDTSDRQQHRVVLIGLAAFCWLKRLQETAPPPRLDLRYLIEGATTALKEVPALILAGWIEDSEQAMFTHMASLRGQPSPVAPRGTGSPAWAAEGAHARTQGQQDRSATARRRSDCRALQIGEPAFLWLKSVQRSTRDPRIELRYLLEGACALLERKPELLQPVIGHARQALAEHLAQLARLPISPIHLEQTQ